MRKKVCSERERISTCREVGREIQGMLIKQKERRCTYRAEGEREYSHVERKEERLKVCL